MGNQVDYWATFEEGCSYHIYNRSINKENIFQKEEYGELFLRKCKKHLLSYFDFEAYCIMPNHFHLLVRVKPISDEILEKIKWEGTSKSMKFLRDETPHNDFLIDQFKRFFQSFAVIYNRERSRNGSVFQNKFKRILIKDEFKWRYILAYIHHNPIHHGFREVYDDWKFSSYLSFVSNTPTSIAREKVLSRFDDELETAKKIFVQYHKDFKLDKGTDEF